MTRFVRIMLGRGSIYAQDCFDGGFAGVDFDLKFDLANLLPDNWRAFNHEYVPVWMSNHPGKSKIAAGLACGMTWSFARNLSVGDYIIAPTGDGRYRFGEIVGDYEYKPGEILFHRRRTRWTDIYVSPETVSEPLRKSMRSIGTLSDVTQYADELQNLLSGQSSGVLIEEGAVVEQPSVFVLEKYLEEFLVSNWTSTEFGKNYDIFFDEETSGQQYQTDAGRIDILAVSKNQKELLVIELKRGRASDEVAGQLARYMGFVMTQLALPDQVVKGVIVALEDDSKLRYSLAAIPNTEFYKYEVNFKLLKI